MLRHFARWRGVALACVLVGAISGCSNGVDPAVSTSAGSDFDGQVSQAIADALNSGASDQQLAILEGAAARGVVTFEDAKIAATNTMDCMSSRGVSSTYEETSLSSGVTIPGYTVEAQKSDGSSALDDLELCENAESAWVNMLYQTQPTSIESNLAFIEKQAPVIRKCLEDAGYDTDPKATGMDLVLQSSDIERQTGGQISCAFDAGVVTY